MATETLSPFKVEPQSLPNSARFSVPSRRLPPILRRPHAAALQVRPGETQTRVVPVPVTFPAM